QQRRRVSLEGWLGLEVPFRVALGLLAAPVPRLVQALGLERRELGPVRPALVRARQRRQPRKATGADSPTRLPTSLSAPPYSIAYAVHGYIKHRHSHWLS